MARDRDSYIHRIGLTPNTHSVISSKNRIYALPADDATNSPVQVGVIATFDPSETRTIEPIRGIGYGDQVAELVPGVTDPMSITITRSAQYLSLVFQAFGYKGGVDGFVRSLKHHRWPFDVRQELVFSELALNHDSTSDQNLHQVTDEAARALITIYEACWMSDYGTSYASDTALVQENVTLMVSDVLAFSDDNQGLDYSDNDETGNTPDVNGRGSIRFMGGNGGPFPQPVAGNL